MGLVGLTASCISPAAAPPPTAPVVTPPIVAPTTTVAPPTGAPVITAFSVTAGPVAAPALVAFAWTASDPDGTAVTCTIDANGDSAADITIPNCQVPGSRTFTYNTPGSFAPVVTATDGTHSVTSQTSISVVAGVSEPYNIVIRPVSVLSAPIQAAFDAAAAKWESIIVRGVAPISMSAGTPGCLAGAADLPTSIDDLVIDVDVTPIDGVGNVLGSAGPCWWANVDGLTRVGDMKFDSADVADMLTSGLFADVVVHEMGHILGLGTRWNAKGLLTGGGTANPRFTGTRAAAEYSRLGGTTAVPVENSGGGGTADAHWRESVFGTEVMTGWISAPPNPLSALTIASMADLGYQVDISRADAYSLPGMPALRMFGAPAGQTVLDAHAPIGSI